MALKIVWKKEMLAGLVGSPFRAHSVGTFIRVFEIRDHSRLFLCSCGSLKAGADKNTNQSIIKLFPVFR